MHAAQETLNRTPLYNEHIASGAKMVPFGGWEMPVQYHGIFAEHEHTRNAVTIFDTCHMGEFLIHGDCCQTGLDAIVTMSIADMPVKTCRYGMALKDDGGILDDLVVFREAPQEWFIVVNGATTEKDAKHFRAHLKQPQSFEDISPKIGKIDVQGPLSRQTLAGLVNDPKRLEKLSYYTFDYFQLLGEEVRISRTGYTGELGYEIYSSSTTVAAIWRTLRKHPQVKPAGLGARDVLRLEVGYSLYGHELNETTTPLEAGLERFVNFTKDFIGKDALLKQKKQGLNRKITGLISQTRRSPRQDQKIYSETGETLGIITSGTFSPQLQCGIGLGFIPVNNKFEKINFGDDKNKNPAIISARTFYKKGSLKSET